MDITNISSMHLDVLKEICNIGAGNAATSLSQLLSQRIDLKVPNANVVGFNDLLGIFENQEIVTVGIMILIEGDIDGSMIFIIPKESAGVMLTQLIGKEYNADTRFDEMDMSAMKEIGNIIVSSYINSLSELTGLKIRVSEPFATIDMAAAILSVPVIEIGMTTDYVLFMESHIESDGFNLDGHFIMLPSMESYRKIMENLGV